jgi:hypothetical protein
MSNITLNCRGNEATECQCCRPDNDPQDVGHPSFKLGSYGMWCNCYDCECESYCGQAGCGGSTEINHINTEHDDPVAPNNVGDEQNSPRDSFRGLSCARTHPIELAYLTNVHTLDLHQKDEDKKDWLDQAGFLKTVAMTSTLGFIAGFVTGFVTGYIVTRRQRGP